MTACSLCALTCSDHQLCELELLQSMYTQNELTLDQEWKSSLNITPILLRLNLSLSSSPPVQLEVTLHLPLGYPCSEPVSVLLRSEQLDCSSLSQAVRQYITNLPLHEPQVSQIIDWLQENYSTYLSSSPETPKHDKIIQTPPFQRLWIYSHHIYSSTKRKNILHIAHDLKLTGFMLPGKPGVVCVEGPESICQDFWSQIRKWNWQKLVVKYSEEGGDIGARFSKFEEKVFAVRQDGKRMDLGEFKAFLDNHNLAHVFDILFDLGA